MLGDVTFRTMLQASRTTWCSPITLCGIRRRHGIIIDKDLERDLLTFTLRVKHLVQARNEVGTGKDGGVGSIDV